VGVALQDPRPLNDPKNFLKKIFYVRLVTLHLVMLRWYHRWAQVRNQTALHCVGPIGIGINCSKFVVKPTYICSLFPSVSSK
jgi:hypothetical protein